MKKFSVLVLLFIGLLLFCNHARSQTIQKAEQPEQASESPADTIDRIERLRQDSVKLQEVTLELQGMKLNEILLRSQLDSIRNFNHIADSIKLEQQRRSIDSLRSVTPGAPVIVDNDTLFLLYAGRGGYSAIDRADMAIEAIEKIGSDRSISRGDTVYILENEGFTDLMCGSKVIISITDQDALWQGVSRAELAERYKPLLDAKIRELRDEHSFFQIVKRVILFILVIIGQYLLVKLTNFLFRKLRRSIIRFKQQRLKPVIIHDYELLNKRRLGRILIFFSNVLRYLVYLILFIFSVPMLFAIFPQTEKLALTILHYIMEPVRMICSSIVAYIPNLFIILAIWLCIKYIVMGLRFISDEVSSEKLKITGFYPDWAKPTFNIIRFLLYAFMIAMIYPYLPGADSGAFQGISVFVGLILSLGSSAVIGNIIAGMVITYMRPFKLGDRIKLNETIGHVIEKTPFVTRLRTPKNEVVTIPNSFVMSSHTVNYSASARQFGLIIHTTVTIGYDAPWRQVHQLLIDAALSTPGVLEDPKPFVLETDLQDFYPCYQINAYINDADNLAQITSSLHQHIQDKFNEAGVEIMSPHYFAHRDGNASTIPADYLKSR